MLVNNCATTVLVSVLVTAPLKLEIGQCITRIALNSLSIQVVNSPIAIKCEMCVGIVAESSSTPFACKHAATVFVSDVTLTWITFQAKICNKPSGSTVDCMTIEVNCLATSIITVCGVMLFGNTSVSTCYVAALVLITNALCIPLQMEHAQNASIAITSDQVTVEVNHISSSMTAKLRIFGAAVLYIWTKICIARLSLFITPIAKGASICRSWIVA